MTDLTLDFAMTQINAESQNNNNNPNLMRNLSQSLTNISNSTLKNSTPATTTTTISTSSLDIVDTKPTTTTITSTSTSSTSSLNFKTSKNSLLEIRDVTKGNTTNEALRRHSINNIPNLFDENDSKVLLCYLCIKVNTHKDFISCPMDRKMKNRLQSEFWFQVPDNR